MGGGREKVGGVGEREGAGTGIGIYNKIVLKIKKEITGIIQNNCGFLFFFL